MANNRRAMIAQRALNKKALAAKRAGMSIEAKVTITPNNTGIFKSLPTPRFVKTLERVLDRRVNIH